MKFFYVLLMLIAFPMTAPFDSTALPFSNSDFVRKYKEISFVIDRHDFKGTPNDKLLAINNFVNHSLAYRSEAVDEWSNPADTLARGYGDCEDFALLKMALLFQTGFDPNDVSLLIVAIPGQVQYHAVVAVRSLGGYVILDSLNNHIFPDRMLKYIPVFQILNGKGFILGKTLSKTS